MKFLFVVVFTCFFVHHSVGQKNHFVYVQSENKQPFYIKISDVVYSSSSAGYAIIPKLTKNDYLFTIGFPKNQWPQVQIMVPVLDDAGFELKNLPGKGWSLYNMQSMTFLNSSERPKVEALPATTAENSFGNVLAGVTNTPDLNKVKPEAVAEQKTPVTVAVSDTVVKTVPPSPNVVQAPVVSIQKIFDLVDEEGYSLAYVENVLGITDTIRIFIKDTSLKKGMALQPVPAESKTTQPAAVENKTETTQPAVEIKVNASSAEPVTDPRFLDIDINNKTSKTDDPIILKPKEEQASKSSKPLMVNSDCKSIAVEDDFFKLRKKMAAQKDEDEMVRACDKFFKAKCYSTMQIKNLSALFLTDRGRFGFYSAAYPFVHDTQNFKTLGIQLSEEYYVNLFNALTKK